MIIVRLRGGLGNQLFQYAAGRSLAAHHGTELKLDLYTYTKHPYRKYELGKFKITGSIASRSEVHRFTGSNFLIRYINKRENYFRCPNVCAQPHYHFFEDFFLLPRESYLSGYWQSEKYFVSISQQIRNEFVPLDLLDERNARLQEKMKSENSVSVHIRRGDYHSPTYSKFFGMLPKDYYDNALQIVRKEVPDARLYFFSDDPQWVRGAFPGVKGEFIEHNRGEDSYKDMLLMSSCRHNIIANSSFSWWAAWLNKNASKKVIAPRRWFRENFLAVKEPVYPSRVYNTKDLIPDEWIKL